MVRPFVRHARELLLETPIFNLHRERAEHPGTGHVGTYYVLDNPDWVNVVALTPDRRMILVRQWRHGTRRVELEIPAGLMEPGESPLETAARELREETGYVAERLTLLGAVAPNAAYQSNTCHTVLAEGCRPTGETAFDEGEDIEVDTVALDAVPALLRAGEFRNALVLVGLLWWLDREGRVAW